MLKLYNDLVKKKEEFKPIIENKVQIYVCGLTVYDSPHVGHVRMATAFDLLRRYLLFKDYDVTFVSNYTDVDDKMINRANELEVTVKELADKYIGEYEVVVKDLNVIDPDIKPLATESIDSMIFLIGKIIENGYGYESNGSVYFDVEKFAKNSNYNTLFQRKDTSEQEDEQTDVVSNYDAEKKSKRDFALWKKTKEGEPSWESPYGVGRPGWHLECSAMIYEHLGEQIDIHGGGKDLIFPHHTNEIAQTQAAIGTNLANYWVHNGFLNINNEKMSKSLNNFFTAKDVIKEFGGMTVRLLLTSVNYRSPINYSDDVLHEAKRNYDKIKDFYDTIKSFPTSTEIPESEKQKLLNTIESLKEKFLEALDDDLNTPNAISQLYQLIKLINSWIFEEKKTLDSDIKNLIINFLMDFSNIFGVVLDDTVQQLGKWSNTAEISDELVTKKNETISGLMELLIKIRTDLRKKKLYKMSDEIRDELKKLGIELSDMKGNTLWKISSEI
jgi:cysteinyl-tRNA synthetase